jgi:hypothetical protein
MFSALVVMICCAVPAFALTNSDLPTGSYNPEFEERYKTAIAELKSKYPDKFKNYVMMLPYYDSSFNQICFYWFNCDNSNNFEVYEKNKSYYIKNTDSKPFTSYRIFLNTRTSLFSDLYVNGTSSTDNFDYALSWQIYDTNCNVKFGDKYEFGKPKSDVPAPFTVTCTPELSLNMQNKIYYPSKGGANADENGLVSAENNNINLDIKLTPEFLKTFNEKDLGKAYGSGTYAVLCCLSKNLLNTGDDLQRFFDEDVVLYAMNHDGNYYKGQDDEKVKADGSASDDLNSNGTVDTFEPYLTLYQGRTPIYTIPRDGKLSVAFDLTSIDYETHGLTDDSQLYVNVIGVFVKNNGHVNPQNGENTEDTTSSTWLGSYAYQEDFTNLKTCEKIDDFVKSVDEETGKPETFKAYRVYSVISDPFSYEKFPDYVPKVYKDKDGNTYNPSTTKLKDLCNIPPSKVTDVDLAKGSDGVINDGSYMQPDDYNKYLDKKKINANFGSVDFTDIKSIFSTTGTYWDFLTAALSCLPSWFYAVFSAWFVLFLAIALIKLVLPT